MTNEDGVTIDIYSRDHGPAHAHVKGKGAEVRTDQNGKPLKGESELSSARKDVVGRHLREISNRIRDTKKDHAGL